MSKHGWFRLATRVASTIERFCHLQFLQPGGHSDEPKGPYTQNGVGGIPLYEVTERGCTMNSGEQVLAFDID